MTFYEQEIKRIREIVYANQGQIDTVIRVKNHIDRQYPTALHLDELAEQQFVSKFHLLRLFKRYYGLTPGQYLMDRRIEAAKKHLKNGHSVTETCFAVGFESLGSFSSLFKRKTGKAPAQFQKEQFSRSI